MFRMYFSLIFLQLEVFHMLVYVTFGCDHNERSVFYLDAALDMISKAKIHFPVCNDNIYVLSNQRFSAIRFDLQAVDGEKRHAHYDNFWIEDESNKYRLHIGGYSGDAGDSMASHHDNRTFSTMDQDNENDSRNCADKYKGAWWYNSCHLSNLNGLYYRGVHETDSDGVNWHTFKGYKEALDATEMKIRPKDFRRKLVSGDITLYEICRSQNLSNLCRINANLNELSNLCRINDNLNELPNL